MGIDEVTDAHCLLMVSCELHSCPVAMVTGAGSDELHVEAAGISAQEN